MLDTVQHPKMQWCKIENIKMISILTQTKNSNSYSKTQIQTWTLNSKIQNSNSKPKLQTQAPNSNSKILNSNSKLYNFILNLSFSEFSDV